MQWVIKWYGMGKTSVESRFNIPGRIAWMTMEAPGFLTLLYIMNTMPEQHGITDLPWQNRVLGGLFVRFSSAAFFFLPVLPKFLLTYLQVIHYINRAIIFPLVQPSMAPIHAAVWSMALSFQICNATCLASWLSAYGVVTEAGWDKQSPVPQFVWGLCVFYFGLVGNWLHDEELREIRRKEQRRQEKARVESESSDGTPVVIEKHYEIPSGGLFKYMLYPHYFCEWIEWSGFLIAAGWTCAPARAFLINEFFTMLPRAVNGKKWYVQKFGEEEVRKKWVVLPGVW